MIHELLKPGLETFEHYFASVKWALEQISKLIIEPL